MASYNDAIRQAKKLNKQGVRSSIIKTVDPEATYIPKGINDAMRYADKLHSQGVRAADYKRMSDALTSLSSNLDDNAKKWISESYKASGKQSTYKNADYDIWLRENGLPSEADLDSYISKYNKYAEEQNKIAQTQKMKADFINDIKSYAQNGIKSHDYINPKDKKYEDEDLFKAKFVELMDKYPGIEEYIVKGSLINDDPLDQKLNASKNSGKISYTDLFEEIKNATNNVIAADVLNVVQNNALPSLPTLFPGKALAQRTIDEQLVAAAEAIKNAPKPVADNKQASSVPEAKANTSGATFSGQQGYTAAPDRSSSDAVIRAGERNTQTSREKYANRAQTTVLAAYDELAPGTVESREAYDPETSHIANILSSLPDDDIERLKLDLADTYDGIDDEMRMASEFGQEQLRKEKWNELERIDGAIKYIEKYEYYKKNNTVPEDMSIWDRLGYDLDKLKEGAGQALFDVGKSFILAPMGKVYNNALNIKKIAQESGLYEKLGLSNTETDNAITAALNEFEKRYRQLSEAKIPGLSPDTGDKFVNSDEKNAGSAVFETAGKVAMIWALGAFAKGGATPMPDSAASYFGYNGENVASKAALRKTIALVASNASSAAQSSREQTLKNGGSVAEAEQAAALSAGITVAISAAGNLVPKAISKILDKVSANISSTASSDPRVATALASITADDYADINSSVGVYMNATGVDINAVTADDISDSIVNAVVSVAEGKSVNSGSRVAGQAAAEDYLRRAGEVLNTDRTAVMQNGMFSQPNAGQSASVEPDQGTQSFSPEMLNSDTAQTFLDAEQQARAQAYAEDIESFSQDISVFSENVQTGAIDAYNELAAAAVRDVEIDSVLADYTDAVREQADIVAIASAEYYAAVASSRAKVADLHRIAMGTKGTGNAAAAQVEIDKYNAARGEQEAKLAVERTKRDTAIAKAGRLAARASTDARKALANSVSNGTIGLNQGIAQNNGGIADAGGIEGQDIYGTVPVYGGGLRESSKSRPEQGLAGNAESALTIRATGEQAQAQGAGAGVKGGGAAQRGLTQAEQTLFSEQSARWGSPMLPAADITAETQNILKRTKGFLGREVFLYDQQTSAAKEVVAPGGLETVFVKNTNTPMIAFAAGHGDFHFHPDRIRLAKGVLDSLENGSQLVEQYKSKMIAHANKTGSVEAVRSANEADHTEEFLCDLYGIYVYSVVNDEDTSSKFAQRGLTESEAEQFIDLFSRFTQGIQENTEKDSDFAEVSDLMEKVAPSAGTKYSIVTLDDGRQYVKVDTDQDIFNGADPKAMPGIAKRYILEHFQGTVVGQDKNRAFVNRKTAEEYSYPANVRVDKTIKEAEMRAATELDNLLTVSEKINDMPEADDGRHPEAVGGWDKYKTVFSVSGRYFEGVVNIMNMNRGRLFYDVTKIKDITSRVMDQLDIQPTIQSKSDVPSNSYYAQNGEKVNKNNSEKVFDSILGLDENDSFEDQINVATLLGKGYAAPETVAKRQKLHIERAKKALDMFMSGVSVEDYYLSGKDSAGDKWNRETSNSLRRMWLAKGVNVGGSLSQDAVDKLTENISKWDVSNGLLGQLRLNATSPVRVFEAMGRWRDGKSSAELAANEKEAAEFKEHYWGYGIEQNSLKTLWMSEWGNKVRNAVKNPTTAEASLAQLIGEQFISDSADVVTGAGGTVAVEGDNIFALDARGNVRAIQFYDGDKFYTVIAEHIKEGIRGSIKRVMHEGKLDIKREKGVVEVRYNGRKLLHVNNSAKPNTGRVRALSSALRSFYDAAVKSQQIALTSNGYAPMGELPNYFPHIGRNEVGIKAALKAFGENNLPENIAGLTMDFKPGKPWTSHLLSRIGDSTEFDGIRGFNRYLDAAGELIFMTPVVQRLRQLENVLRANPNGRNSKIVTWLNAYADSIAHKKSDIDRSLEAMVGREAYTISDKLAKITGQSMILGNVSSAVTNFIGFLTAIPNIDGNQVVKALLPTIHDMMSKTGDGFTEKIPALNVRFNEYEKILTGRWDRIKTKGAKVAGALFMAVDRFSVETAARAKYTELLERGLSEAEVVRRTNEFVVKNFAERSTGQMPLLFLSKGLKPLAQFQLEPTNQLSHFSDMKHYSIEEQIDLLEKVSGKDVRELADIEGKIRYTTPKELFRKLLYLFYLAIFTGVGRLLFGRDMTWNAPGMIYDAVKNGKQNGFWAGVASAAEDISDNLPFTSLVTGGGRIPMTTGVENVITLGETLFGGKANSKMTGSLIRDAALSFIPAGNQIGKTWKGVEAMTEGGVYDRSGEKLRYPVEDSGLNWARVLINGPAAAKPQGFDYLNDTLSKTKTEQYEKIVEGGVDPEDAYDLLSDYNSESKAAEVLSIASYEDENGNNLPQSQQNLIAAVLGINVDKGKKISVKYGKELADEYLKDKKTDLKKDRITQDQFDAAEEKYDYWMTLIGGRR